MSDVLYLNEVDVETTYGLSLTAMPGAWSAPVADWPTVSIPGFDGTRITRDRPAVGARVLQFGGLIRGTSASDAEAKLQTLKDAIWEREVAIRYGYQSGRAYRGVLQSCEAGLFSPGNLEGWAAVQLSFLCADPYASDTTPTVVTGAATDVLDVQLGTGPTWCSVRIIGAATNPVLTMKNSAGATLGTMSFTKTLTDATEVLVIDATEGGEAWLDDGGAISDAIGDLAAGYRFPIFSPRDGVRGSSAWPTIEVSSGDLEVSYVRRWI